MVANFAHIPENLNDPVESLAIYTALFNKLGFAGILCTLIAVAMLPLMKKLSASHAVRRPSARPCRRCAARSSTPRVDSADQGLTQGREQAGAQGGGAAAGGAGRSPPRTLRR